MFDKFFPSFFKQNLFQKKNNEAISTVREAIEKGVNFFDTSAFYGKDGDRKSVLFYFILFF